MKYNDSTEVERKIQKVQINGKIKMKKIFVKLINF